jgi:hypothetical protein
VSTWSGFAYVAFVTDAYARRILGWRVASTMTTAMVLDGIEQAIWTRQREGLLDLKDVVHHTDRGSQYTSIRFTERLAEAGIQPSVGAVGSSYDNALAETINGLYKTELTKPRKPWRTIEEVELATADGSTGSTTAASTNTAATSHPSIWRQPITLNTRDQPPAELSNQKVSGLTGARPMQAISKMDNSTSLCRGYVNYLRSSTSCVLSDPLTIALSPPLVTAQMRCPRQ